MEAGSGRYFDKASPHEQGAGTVVGGFTPLTSSFSTCSLVRGMWRLFVFYTTDLFEPGGNQFLIVISFLFFAKNVYKPLTHMIRNVARCYSINFGEQIKTVSNRKI